MQVHVARAASETSQQGTRAYVARAASETSQQGTRVYVGRAASVTSQQGAQVHAIAASETLHSAKGASQGIHCAGGVLSNVSGL